jgi:hypothetical protein
VGFKRIDRAKFASAAARSTPLLCVAAIAAASATSSVARRAFELVSSRRRSRVQERPCSHHRLRNARVRCPRGVAIVQRGVIVVRKPVRLKVVRPPPRDVCGRVFVQVRVRAQSVRHAAQLAVLFTLHIKQQLLDRGGNAIPNRDRGVVHHDLRGGRQAREHHQREAD